MEASVQSDDKFQRVPPDPQKINWEFWSWEDGGWLVQLAWFSACPHMTVPRPELADAASLCSCHRCVFQSRWSCQWEDDSVLTAAPPSLFRASQINMLGFKAATADIGHWVRGPNAEQKHSRPLVTCSQWAWSPRRGTHSAWAVHRAPRGPALTHCLLGELCMPPSASDSHHSFFIFWASLWLTRWRARNNEKTERDSAERGGGEGGGRPRPADWLWGGTHSSTPFLLVSSAKVEEEEKPTVVMWAELRQLHLTHKWSSSLATLCIIGWLLHVCHCVTKTDRGAKVRGDCVLMFLSFFFPLVFNIYESRIMTTAPKHNHQPCLPTWPLWNLCKRKRNHVSFFKHSNKKTIQA